MRKTTFLIVVSFMIPFMLYSEDLPYDYIENNPKMDRELAEYNAEQKRKKREYRNKITETSGFMIGVGANVGYPLGGGNIRTIGGSYDYAGYKVWWDKQYDLTKLNYGVNTLLGYKWFFTYVFGLRLYVDYNARFLDAVVSHNIIANLDLMFNIFNTQSFKFGLFFGGGIGGSVEQVNMKYCLLYPELSCEKILSAFSGNLNFGLRFVINNNSAIEVLTQLFIARGDYPYKYYDFYIRYDPAHSNVTLKNNSVSIGEISLLGTLRFIYTF